MKLRNLILTAVATFGICFQAFGQVPAGLWADRGAVVEIIDAGGGRIELKVHKQGSKTKWTRGTGKMTGKKTRKGNPLFNMALYKGDKHLVTKKDVAFNPTDNIIRYSGGEGIISWNKYTAPNEIAQLKRQLNIVNNQNLNLTDQNAKLRGRLQNDYLKFNLLWAARLSKSARTEIIRQKLTGKNVAAVSYTDASGNIGTLSKKGAGIWIERNFYGDSIHEFKEVSRTADAVLLHDVKSKTHIDLKIDVKSCEILVYENNIRVDSYSLTGAAK